MKTDLVKIVGVSAAGKSTLVAALRRLGYNARPVAQEHSQVPAMWQRIRPPVWLIFLDVDLPGQGARRPDVSWSEPWRRTELKRLAHGAQQCRSAHQHQFADAGARPAADGEISSGQPGPACPRCAFGVAQNGQCLASTMMCCSLQRLTVGPSRATKWTLILRAQAMREWAAPSVAPYPTHFSTC